VAKRGQNCACVYVGYEFVAYDNSVDGSYEWKKKTKN
jgi:hypothetical protein